MNTKIHYQYRDASNYKAGGSEIVKGEMSELTGDDKKYFEEIEDFIPHELGFPSLQSQLAVYSGGELTGDDHVWHTLEECVKTKEKHTIDMTMNDFVRKYISAERNEIDECVRLGI